MALNVMFIKMIKNIITVYLLSLFLVGCTSVPKKPTIKDLTGVWESTGPFSYLQLNIEKNENGYLSVIFSEKRTHLFKLIKFISLENGFKLKFEDVEGKEKPFTLEGKILIDRIYLASTEKPNETMWFMKSEAIEKFKKQAFTNLNEYKTK